MISVRVLNRQATAINRWPITSGSVGMPVDFIFSSEWDELTKTAIFRGSGEAIDVALTDDSCVVPWETLAEAGGDLYIGVYGSNGDDVVIPTVWCNAGYIKEGAVRSEVDPADPTPSWADQVQQIAAEAKQIAQSVRTDADNGVFDGADGTDGADGSTIWITTVAPAEPIGGGYEFMVSDLTGAAGATPAVGDLIFYDSAYYPITSVAGHSALDRKAIADRRVPIGNEVELPAAPGTDGVYVLKCTVTNGTPVYSWAAAE